jgi:hypothetical protein
MVLAGNRFRSTNTFVIVGIHVLGRTYQLSSLFPRQILPVVIGRVTVLIVLDIGTIERDEAIFPNIVIL